MFVSVSVVSSVFIYVFIYACAAVYCLFQLLFSSVAFLSLHVSSALPSLQYDYMVVSCSGCVSVSAACPLALILIPIVHLPIFIIL